MFNVVQSALKKKKKDEKPNKDKDKAEIRLVTSGETHKNDQAKMPPPEELKKAFGELLVCTKFVERHTCTNRQFKFKFI
jgi:hypothetical protein